MQYAYATPGTFVSSLSRSILARAARERQGVRRFKGDRPAPSLAAHPVDVIDVTTTRRLPSGRVVRESVTELGLATAVRREPLVLSKLERDDPRRVALVAYITAAERQGAVRGQSISPMAGGGSGEGVPDGGATTRAMQSAAIRKVHGVINGWRWCSERRSFETGPLRPVLKAQRGKARMISASDLLDAVALEGLDMASILTRFGWSTHSKHRKALTEAFEDMLEILVDELGCGTRRRS